MADFTGRCYCGAKTISVSAPPVTVAYCHCSDCRRMTGAPVAAFAAFAEGTVAVSPDEGRRVSLSPGVTRSFCEHCGSSLTGRYDYLPRQVYLAVGLFDQINELVPQVHAHHDSKVEWLHLEDQVARAEGSARTNLNAVGKCPTS